MVVLSCVGLSFGERRHVNTSPSGPKHTMCALTIITAVEASLEIRRNAAQALSLEGGNMSTAACCISLVLCPSALQPYEAL